MYRNSYIRVSMNWFMSASMLVNIVPEVRDENHFKCRKQWCNQICYTKDANQAVSSLSLLTTSFTDVSNKTFN